MELTISLDLGRLRAELAGDERQEVQEELVEFINFIEQNEDVLTSYMTPESGSVGESGSDEKTGNEIENHHRIQNATSAISRIGRATTRLP